MNQMISCPFGCRTARKKQPQQFRSYKNGILHCLEKHTSASDGNLAELGFMPDEFLGETLKKRCGYKSRKLDRPYYGCRDAACGNRQFEQAFMLIGHVAENHMNANQQASFWKDIEDVGKALVESEESSEASADEDIDGENPMFAGVLRSRPNSASRSVGSTADVGEVDELDGMLGNLTVADFMTMLKSAQKGKNTKKAPSKKVKMEEDEEEGGEDDGGDEDDGDYEDDGDEDVDEGLMDMDDVNIQRSIFNVANKKKNTRAKK